MPQENVQLLDRENAEMVRKPLRVRERSSRTLDQRFFLRFPRANAAFARLISRAAAPLADPPGCCVANRAARVEAVNRHDLNAMMLSPWSEAWGGDWRCEPVEFTDLGHRALLLQNLVVRARASSLPLTEKHAVVYS